LKVALVHISAGVDATPASPVIDHLGIEMISGALDGTGYSPVQFDSLLQGLSDGLITEAIMKEEPGIVACSMNYANWSQSLQLLQEIKAADRSIFCVAGGYYATFHWDSILLNEYCDCCIVGEGEWPLVQLCDAVSKRLPPDGIAGAAFLRDGRPVCNSPARVDTSCWSSRADRQLLHLLEKFPDGSRKIALERSRGCYHNCAFCSIAAQQGLSGQTARRRVRDADDLIDEIRALQSRSLIRDYWFMDATFLGPAGDKPQDFELARKLAQINDGHMNLEIDTRADTINSEIIGCLKEAGLSRVFLGVESFEQEALNLFSKGASVKANYEAVAILEKANVDYILGTILLSPQKTFEQFSRDHEALKSIGYEHTQMLFRLKMYRGTRMADQQDCHGRGIMAEEDYGWQFDDPRLDMLWKLIDSCRLALLDIVFTDLTQRFRQARISTAQFERMARLVYSRIAGSIDDALYALRDGQMPDDASFILIRDKLLADISGFRNKTVMINC